MRDAMRRTRAQLEALLIDRDLEARVAQDPISVVHRYRRPEDQEAAGLIAALLAFGRIATILTKVDAVLAALGPRPAKAMRDWGRGAGRLRLPGFRHRVWTESDLLVLLSNAGNILATEGSLGARISREAPRLGLREALARLADRLRGPDAPRSLRHLVPDPRAGSACKRLLLYARWMVRRADGVDLGLWPLAPRYLVMPLDTHVHRISQNLGLTARKDASWRTAEEVTASLRRFDPDDPVKYDFALCHFGVSKACPSRRVPTVCAACVLRGVCVHWSASA